MGRELQIRELTAADRHALRFMFDHLGIDSRYQRFMTLKRELSGADLRQLTSVDHWHHEAVIAWTSSPRRPVGVAHYYRADEFDEAELAVTVVDAWQRHGVGRQLLAQLQVRAQKAGIRRFKAIALSTNRGAIALTRSLGPDVVARNQGPVVEVSGSWCPS